MTSLQVAVALYQAIRARRFSLEPVAVTPIPVPVAVRPVVPMRHSLLDTVGHPLKQA
ncbi:MAG: hypothetical protein KKA73_13705 [Chloroflexi bacterium]|nr:hypothetical protein [Chloroflexota bacterium]MBU1748738.1 hypothetical protein [Chloroflexota bacterium]